MRIHALALLLLAVPAAAQQPRQLTAEDYARAERRLAAHTTPLVTGTAGPPTWTADGRFWYRSNTPEGARYFMVDPARGTREPLFDPARLTPALGTAGGEIPAGQLPVVLDLTEDGRRATVFVRGGRLTCDLQAYTCARAAATPDDASLSPDGRMAAFIRDFNLWVKDLASGRETQLTTDGSKEFGYATNNAGWVHGDDPVLTWSPDSRQIATFQHDARGVSDMYLVSTNVGEPRLEAWKYPLPGDSVIFRIHRVVVNVADAARPRVVRFQMPADQHRSTVSDHTQCSGGTVCDLQWYPDGSKVAFVSSSRDHKTAWVRVADARTGEVRTLFEERSQTQVGDASFTENLWRIVPGTNELIWWSQREGWTRLYLYDLNTGRLKNAITTGEGNVMDIVRVDERARTIYFTAQGREAGRDPYFQQLYRIGFDGRGQTLLTPEDAHHTVSMSADGRFIVDTYSTPDTPPVTVVRDMNGRVVRQLERADVSRLVATGWRPPTRIRMKARDGQTDIYGLMFTPAALDSTRKYPIVNYIYPGPQVGSVGPRSFMPSRSDHQALAELGFVVVAIDGMGTPGRSKAFADAYYGRMIDNTLPDQIAGMRELARRYPFIDIDRAGIWGHSGGGYATAAAMFRHPEFFKVGISESGNHDNRNYEDDWGERYHGMLVRTGTTDNYANEATQTHAANLRGKLMLAHGGMDDNVPPYNTYLVVDALVKANKDFDLVIFPNARHGYGADSGYMMRRRWDYFVRNLMGAEPPREYQIGRLGR
ncbi:MAG TPA: DPP IV N-terminal domain-containing protein [Longimicrobium sp.]|jgi:dipeptidyl aminopeptidase/acylaminoacyl peptidase